MRRRRLSSLINLESTRPQSYQHLQVLLLLMLDLLWRLRGALLPPRLHRRFPARGHRSTGRNNGADGWRRQRYSDSFHRASFQCDDAFDLSECTVRQHRRIQDRRR